MTKKTFHSQLFARSIDKNEKDYEVIVKTELLFRIKELERKEEITVAAG